MGPRGSARQLLRRLVGARVIFGARARRLNVALSRALDEDEARWADRIEALREQVEQSEQVIADKRSEPRTVGAVAERASKKRANAELLMKAVRDFKPAYGIEMGTCVGISAAYQAAAMALNGAGRLVSLEGYAVLSDVARANIAELGLDHVVEVRQGKFEALLAPALAEQAPDYGFIDGNHKEGPTLEYFRAFANAARPETLLVFDDITWSDDMRRAWRQIRGDARSVVTVSVGSMGFCLVDSRSRRRLRDLVPGVSRRSPSGLRRTQSGL